MGLSTKLVVAASAALTSAQDLGEAKATLSKTYAIELLSGVAVGQADRVFHDQRTLLASSNEDLDLAGVLLDPLGAVLTFAKVKGLIIAAAAGNTNDVVVGGAAATQFLSWVGAATHTVKVRPGAVFALLCGQGDSAGYAAGAGADFLRIANGGAGTSVTYDVIVIGTSS